MELIFQKNYSLLELDSLAKEIVFVCGREKNFYFYGEMGSGKTTLIKALCKHLQVSGTVNSPTFSIINEYHSTENGNIFHFDFYRLKDINEAYDLGIENYLTGRNYCFVEWPEKIESVLPENNAVKIVITNENDKDLRTIQIYR